MTLQASAPLRIQTASKAKRGYVLAGGEGYAGYKAPALALARGISANEALGKIFRVCASQCAANHDAVLDRSDPEGVHQFRVALRRMRSALVVFKRVLPPRARCLAGAGKRAVSSTCSARRAIGTYSLPRRSRPFGLPGRMTRHWSVLPKRPRWSVPAPTSRPRRCARPDYTAFLLRFGRWIETAGWRDAANHAALDQPLAQGLGSACSTSATGAY